LSPLPDIGADQLRLLEQARAFVRARSARGLDVAVDPECYLNPWAQDVGHSRLRTLFSGWRARPSYLGERTKDTAAYWLRPCDFDVAASADGYRRPFGTMLVSWSRGSDFNADGVYSDRYVRLSSADTPDVLWFLVSLDDVLPEKIAPNVRICHKVQTTRARGLLSSRSRARAGRPASALNDSGARLPSHARATALAIASAVQSELRSQRVRHLVMAYEAQPFQHAANLVAKAHDPAIVTVGYQHSSLTATPTDFVYRRGAPDRLFVHGSGQADILLRHLDWPAERLQVSESLRYRRGDPAPLAKHILLPYSFDDADRIVVAIEEYLRSAAPRSLPRWSVRNHPVMTSSRKHLDLENRIRSLVSRYEDRTTEDPSADRQTMIIGATAAVIEALERGLEVVHLCANPLLEAHTSAIWRELEVQTLAPSIYRYELKKPGSYIRLGEASLPAGERLGVLLADT